MLLVKYKWLGLAIGGTAVFAGLLVGAFAFKGVLTTQEAYSFAMWCVLIGLVGWALHMVVVLRQWMEKRRQNKSESS